MLPGLFRDQAAVFRMLSAVPADCGPCPAELVQACDAREYAGELLIELCDMAACDMPDEFVELVREYRSNCRRLWRKVVGPTWRPREPELVSLREDGAGILVSTDEVAGGLLFNMAPAAFPPVHVSQVGSPNYKDRDARACAWLASRIEAHLQNGGPSAAACNRSDLIAAIKILGPGTKPNDVIRLAHVAPQPARDELRRLEGDGLYNGFARPRSSKYAKVSKSKP